MIVLDANVWVARFIRTEPRYQHSRQFLRRMVRVRERLAAPRLLLVEVAAIMRQRHDVPTDQQAIQQIQSLRDVRWVPVDDQLINRAIDVALDSHLPAADALYVAAAEHLNVPLYTWDHEILARASQRIHVYAPAYVPVEAP